jgi:uncharacterized protein (TIGR02996 family)
VTADERALLAAVCADPDSNLPRLVYADWLDDHGRPERAEFIRLQCGYAVARDDPARTADRQPILSRTFALGRERGRQWRRGLPALSGVTWGRFRRGFVIEARLELWGLPASEVPALADQVFAAAPVQELYLGYGPAPTRYSSGALARALRECLPRPGSPDGMLAALRHPRLAQLVRLEVAPFGELPAGWFDALFAGLAAHPWPPRLLDLHVNAGAGRGVGRLAETPAGRPFPELVVRGLRGRTARQALRDRFGDRVSFT